MPAQEIVERDCVFSQCPSSSNTTVSWVTPTNKESALHKEQTLFRFSPPIQHHIYPANFPNFFFRISNLMNFSIHGANLSKYSSLTCEKLAPLTAALHLLTLFSFVK
jgi:hypothetical protein